MGSLFAGRAPSSSRRAGPLHGAGSKAKAEGRYLLSPLALERHAGADVVDWKTRLYGLTNAPYRLRAAGNFGEPLTLRASYGMMDFFVLSEER